MDKRQLIEVIRTCKWAVQASLSPSNHPQAAVIGVVVSDAFEIFFDTSEQSRKAANLRLAPWMALVVGWDEGWTAQMEGAVDEPAGADLARLKNLYFGKFPDGRERERWPDIAYFRMRPSWARFSDFRVQPPRIVEVPTA